MTQLGHAQENQLKALMKEFKRLHKRLQAIHDKSGYEDLGHGVLALQIAQHTVKELANAQVWAERFRTSRIQKRTVRPDNGTRS